MKFSFTIRDLLWLTALCAVLVAWWMDRSLTPPTTAAPPAVGRYQLIGGSESIESPTMLDTATGALWRYNSSGRNWYQHRPDINGK
jgi:hypothetical protein